MSIARINSTYLRRSLLLAYAPIFTTLIVLWVIIEATATSIRDIAAPEAKDCWKLLRGAWKGPVL